MRGTGWEEEDKNWAWKHAIFFQNGKVSCLAKTNKRLNQRREHILKLTDVSSLCICYYFRCQRPLQRLSHRLTTVVLTAIMLFFIVHVLLWDKRVLHLLFWWLMLMELRTSLPHFLSCFFLSGNDRDHFVGQSSWRLMPHSNLTASPPIVYPVFNPNQNMSVKGLVRW